MDPSLPATSGTRLARREDLPAAVEVWREANIARGRPPSPSRVERVRVKLADPAAIVIVAVVDGRVDGMVLAEPGRASGGAGALVPGLCHISMVFVRPSLQGQGLGRLLLSRLEEEARRLGYVRLQVWTGVRNEAARRLYRGAGFRAGGPDATLPSGLVVSRFVRVLPAPV
jgi:ribosomal protein S18 acetylase RimI-like enzyme